MNHDENTGSRRSRFAAGTAVLALIIAAGVSSGCETTRIPGVYRIAIQQGNAVDQEMLDQLDIGMEQSKVRFIMGTPLLVDPFNQDRWDYIYSLRPGSGSEVRQRVSLYFDDSDRLARIEGHIEPGAAPEAGAERTRTVATVPPRKARGGILDKLIPDFLRSDDAPQSGSSEPETDPESTQ